MNDKFQNKYRIPSARAPWHNYNGGWYFITICTKDMVCYFGNVVDSRMRLNELGQMIADNLRNASEHYPYCEIPMYVVMPNHIHAIVIIDGEKTPYNRCDNCSRDAARHVSTPPATTTKMTEIANYQGWLSVVIGGIKTNCRLYGNQDFTTISSGTKTNVTELLNTSKTTLQNGNWTSSLKQKANKKTIL